MVVRSRILQTIKMSSSKKRKIVGVPWAAEEPKALSSLQPNASTTTSHIPKYVFIAQELRGGQYSDFEHEILGVYTSCEVANSAAHDYYNKNGSWGEWTIRKRIEPEHEKFRNSTDYSYVSDYDLVESSDGQLGCVRRRHDGGLRLGASSESESYVVWVERKGLDSSGKSTSS